MLISDVDAPKYCYYQYYCFVWKLSQTYFDHFFLGGGGALRYFLGVRGFVQENW